MKYEMIFGDEKLFDGAPDDVDMIGYNGGFYKNSQGGPMYCCGCTFTTDEYRNKGFIAMRRIIKEPVWTVADQKAGQLQEVGSECIYCNGTRPDTVLFVNEKVIILIDTKIKDIDTRPRNYTHEEFMQYYKPIETPKERARRLRDEWCDKFDVVMKNYGCLPEFIYDALLSGELQAPKGGE